MRPNMRLLLSRSEQVGSRLQRSGDIFVAQQKRETLARTTATTRPLHMDTLSESVETVLEAFRRDGFFLLPELIAPGEAARLAAAVSASDVATKRSAGVRNLASRVPEVAALATSAPVRSVVEAVLGPGAVLVRSTLFDKVPEANWNMRWHQDLTIAVERRVEVPGCGPWSVKDGVESVQPPVSVLERLISVRVHLDECDETNGALQVVPGSHRLGRLSAEARERLVRAGPHYMCASGPGGALLMHPLLLHASAPSRRPKHRRVVHLDFANGQLGGGLEWNRRA